MLAPKEMRKERQFRWPLAAARWRGVFPQMSHLSGSPLDSKKNNGLARRHDGRLY